MNSHDALRGKTALVTGAGTRLGRIIAAALGREGMTVGVHHFKHAGGAQETAAEVTAGGGHAELFQADLNSRANARNLVQDAIARMGGLDMLVLSAASFEAVDLEAVDDAVWDRNLNLNLAVPFAMAQAALPSLRARRGNIIFITCSSVISPLRGHLPYVVAKAGLYQLMRTLALELAPEIRVNAVAPGFILPADNTPAELAQRLTSQLPLDRPGEPNDVAQAVVYLAQSVFVTGEQIVVDGGRSLARLQPH